MLKWIDSLLDRTCAAIGGIVLSQAPQFMMQYTQRLSGHIDELRIQISMLRESAAMTGKSLEQYVHKFLSSQDPDFVHQGEIIKNMVYRWEELTAGLQAMKESTPFTRPWAFLSHVNYDIAEAALRQFQPGISFSIETMSYMLLGVVAGALIYRGIRLPAIIGRKKQNSLLRDR